MPCGHCADLCVEYLIRTPSELRKAIAVVNKNLIDGTIMERKGATPTDLTGPSFASVAAGGPWDDIVAYSFQCTNCGEVFELTANTYHGSGGAWRPKKAASVRV